MKYDHNHVHYKVEVTPVSEGEWYLVYVLGKSTRLWPKSCGLARFFGRAGRDGDWGHLGPLGGGGGGAVE